MKTENCQLVNITVIIVAGSDLSMTAEIRWQKYNGK